jgi:tetratricopeptide (TPR) repeat protein
MGYRIRIPSKHDALDEAELLSGAERFGFFLREQRRALLAGFGVLVVAAAVVGGVLWYDFQTSQKATELLREATRHYANRPADDPKKADDQLKQAIAKYREIVEQYPRTPSGPLALFHLGNAQILANEIDAGIESYKRFMLLYASNPALMGLVQQRLGYAYLAKNDRDPAGKAFSSVLDIPGALNKDNVLFELAKLEESQSRPEGALAHYQDLMKNHPNSPFASEAAVRVKVLETKNAVPDSAVPAPSSMPDIPQAEKSASPVKPSPKKK